MEPVTNYFYQIDITAMTTPDKVDALRKMCEEFFVREEVPATYGQAQHLRGLNMGPMDLPQATAPTVPMDGPVPSEA